MMVLFNYFAAKRLEKPEAPPRLLTILVAINLTPLIFIKLNEILILGISFYTFHNVSYLVDVFKKRTPSAKNLWEYFNYLTFFPHMMAGPLIRFRWFADKWAHRLVSVQNFDLGIALCFIGAFKKWIVADPIGRHLVDPIFANPHLFSGPQLLLATYSYSQQIYLDFSGYTDIATGLALFWGMSFPVNFDSPYKARRVTDFWRQWHITLGAWMRDYVYIPLGGNQSRFPFLVIMITMAVAGLWHGADWTFLLWGLFHGFLLVYERITSRAPTSFLSGPLITFHFVCLGWILFRAPSLSSALNFYAGLFSGWNSGTMSAAFSQTSLALVLLAFIFHGQKKILISKIVQVPFLIRNLGYGLVLLGLLALHSKSRAFIYFQF